MSAAPIPTVAIEAFLEDLGLEQWVGPAIVAVNERLTSSGHGDFDTWQRALDALSRTGGDETGLRDALMALSPWRKGPFTLGPVEIDAEWRSDLKWARIRDAIRPLDGHAVLDVGSGNGYYALEMLASGARRVLGIDPTILYVMQFLAVQQFVARPDAMILPFRLEELPLPARAFGTTFSMGVLYHRRSPIDHLRELRNTLRPGGQLVLETLYLAGDESLARTPEDRYARMRNVWLLPTIPELTTWLQRTGFRDVAVADQSVTTTEEQRPTEWMSFESLNEALDPDDPSLTVEGWPRPRRVVMTAISP